MQRDEGVLRVSGALLAALTLACAASGGGRGGDEDGAGSSGVDGEIAVSWRDGRLALVVDDALVGETLVLTQGTGGKAEIALASAVLGIGTDIPADAFSSFATGAASWTAGEASGEVDLGERFTTFFQATSAPDLSVSGVPASAGVGATIRVEGTAGAGGLRPTAYIGHPSGSVIEVALAEFPLKNGATFAFDVVIDAPGIYAVELLLPSGAPGAVHPIYAGAALPVITPPLDRGGTTQKITDLAPLIADLHQRTNAVRATLGLGPAAEHPALTEMAQAKADDIAATKSFSHNSAALGSVVDQFKKAGLTGSVKESLAVEVSAERAFYGWYWSPAHRVVIVDPAWKGQGFGVAWFNQAGGQLVFVQHVASAAP